MDHILRAYYAGGKADLDLWQFFPTNGEKRKKLLELIRGSYENQDEMFRQVMDFLRYAADEMSREKEAAWERYKAYEELAKDKAIYESALSAAERQVKAFDRGREKFVKERLWWESHSK